MNKRFTRRIRPIALNAVQTGLKSFSNVIISLLIIRLFSETLWGEVVFYLIFIDLAFNIIDWGNKNYLILKFSERPDQLRLQWQESIITRFFLPLLAITVLLFLPILFLVKIAIIIWIIGRYIYSSFEPVINYQRDYKFSIVAESVSLIVILIPLLLLDDLRVGDILFTYAVTFIVRALLAGLVYRYFFQKFSFRFSRKFLFSAFPFLLMGLSGLLLSRADLYLVAALLPKSALGQYQVLNSLLLFGLFSISWLLTPFEKNIYRLRPASLKKLQYKMILFGFPASIGLMLFIFIFLQFIFLFEFSFTIYFLGFLYLYSFFFYLIRLYYFSKKNKQHIAVTFSIAAGVVNILTGLILIPSMEIAGALMAAVIGQLCLILLLFQTPLD